MRLFIALPMENDLRQKFAQTQSLLLGKGVRGRVSPPGNLHLTLVFLGSVPDPAPVIAAMKSVKLPKDSLRFDKLTLFGDVLAALYQPNRALSDYVKALRAALDDAGLPYDHQPFRPHVTLCRKTAFPTAGFRLLPFERTLRRAPLPVKEAQLLSSDLSGAAPEYTAIHTEKARR